MERMPSELWMGDASGLSVSHSPALMLAWGKALHHLGINRGSVHAQARVWLQAPQAAH